MAASAVTELFVVLFLLQYFLFGRKEKGECKNAVEGKRACCSSFYFLGK